MTTVRTTHLVSHARSRRLEDCTLSHVRPDEYNNRRKNSAYSRPCIRDMSDHSPYGSQGLSSLDSRLIERDPIFTLVTATSQDRAGGVAHISKRGILVIVSLRCSSVSNWSPCVFLELRRRNIHFRPVIWRHIHPFNRCSWSCHRDKRPCLTSDTRACSVNWSSCNMKLRMRLKSPLELKPARLMGLYGRVV